MFVNLTVTGGLTVYIQYLRLKLPPTNALFPAVRVKRAKIYAQLFWELLKKSL